MSSTSTWQRLVDAAADPGVIESDRVRRRLLFDAMTVGATISSESVGCSITESLGRTFRTPVASSALALRLDSAQYADSDGPCVAACRDGQEHSITVMTEELSYTEFTHAALIHGVRSSLSLPLPGVSRPSALNLYARATSAFDPPRARAVAALLARCAAAILTADPFAAIGEKSTPGERSDAARIARNPRGTREARTIASAVQLICAGDNLDRDGALESLIARSRAEGKTVFHLARQLVDASEPRA